jgi:hypothetical protein
MVIRIGVTSFELIAIFRTYFQIARIVVTDISHAYRNHRLALSPISVISDIGLSRISELLILD